MRSRARRRLHNNRTSPASNCASTAHSHPPRRGPLHLSKTPRCVDENFVPNPADVQCGNHAIPHSHHIARHHHTVVASHPAHPARLSVRPTPSFLESFHLNYEC